MSRFTNRILEDKEFANKELAINEPQCFERIQEVNGIKFTTSCHEHRDYNVSNIPRGYDNEGYPTLI